MDYNKLVIIWLHRITAKLWRFKALKCAQNMGKNAPNFDPKSIEKRGDLRAGARGHGWWSMSPPVPGRKKNCGKCGKVW